MEHGHQYAEVTACKSEYDVIECKSLSIKSSEYEDMAAYRISTNMYKQSECPATAQTIQNETTDITSGDEIYI